MIRFKHITLYQGSKLLLDEVDLTLYPNHKVGIVGPNGCGKSSLFQLIKNELAPEKGAIELPAKWIISSAKQETPASDLNAVDYVLSGHEEYSQLMQALKKAEHNEDGESIARIHGKLEAIQCWSLPAQASKLLSGLSFSQSQMQAQVKSLSGGWRMRLNLAQALIRPAPLLLLDEPTNHLDLEAVLWLQDFLKHHDAMVLTISHDRDFLDSYCNSILHFDQKKLSFYTGNYSSFEKQKHQKQILQQAQFDKQQKQIEHLEKFITRFKAKASKASQAQSRVKALERMDRAQAVEVRQKFSFEFDSIKKDINRLIQLDHVCVGYEEKTILKQLSLEISAGQRIGLLGRNGEGKSTLIKLLCGELEKQSGVIKTESSFLPGYFAQHQVEQLQLEHSPVWHLQELDATVTEQQARNFLGGFAFHGDKAVEKIQHFSGGEKARLVLALITWKKPNFLLLDEPTNHFDIDMREALALALQTYEGAVMLVAHDKNLMESVVDEFWLVNDGFVKPFKGNLKDYQLWLNDNRWGATTKHKLKDQSSKSQDRKQQKVAEAEIRKKRAPLKKQLEKIEKKMEAAHKENKQVEKKLSDNALYSEDNKKTLKEVLERSKFLKQHIDELEDQWLDINEDLEKIQ